MQIIATKLLLIIAFLVAVGCSKNEKIILENQIVFGQVGDFNNYEIIPLPPFLDKEKLRQTLIKLHPKKDKLPLSYSPQHSSDRYYLYLAEGSGDIQHTIYMSLEGKIETEFLFPEGALKIKELLVFLQGEEWCEEKFK